MILSIHQPVYLPWLGLLQKIAKSDVYMVMDDVQLNDSAFQHRTQLLSADGKVKFLTIPFTRKGYLQRPFRELEISDSNWGTRHRDFIANGYRRHPYFKEIFPEVEPLFERKCPALIDAVLDSMRLCFRLFDITPKIVRQSDFDYEKTWKRSELVVGLARAAGADWYLSGSGAQAYLEESAFDESLRLRYDNFKHPIYPQRNSTQFVAGLSSLDMLFNLGIEQSRALLKNLISE